MNVLSLFDGISCARVALDRAGIEVNAYMASEIEKNAIKVSEKNYPDIIRVGSVVRLEVEGQVDLLIGGSPCTDLSIAKKERKGLEGDKSCLFWEFVRIKKECNPQWFILENVASMPKADRDIITREMGVEPVMFNASLVSAQCRKRLFWTNIPFDLPADRGILIKDILEADVDEKFYVKKPMKPTPNKKPGAFVQVGYFGADNECKVGGAALRVYDTEAKAPTLASVGHLVKVGHVEPNVQGNRVYSTDGKATALSAEGGGLAGGTTLILSKHQQTNLREVDEKAHTLCSTMYKGSHANGTTLVKVGRDMGRRLDKDGRRQEGNVDVPITRSLDLRTDDKSNTLTSVGKDNLVVTDRIRKLTPIECERLQGLPDNYTEGVATTNRYRCLGNAFNVDVVAHILSRVKLMYSS
jgi:DNA (cytosine-5)-methyltransferase 3A